MKLSLVKLDEMQSNEKHEGLEFLFISSWEGWDRLDEGVYYFYDPVVKYDIGTLKAGDKIEGFTLYVTKSIVEFNVSDELNLTYKIVNEDQQ